MIDIRIRLACAATILLVTASVAQARDWLFMPSTYSHSPATGQRVEQYALLPPVIVYQRPDYLRSGLRQQRSTIRAGGSLDSYHVVDQYGGSIRPYGEWLYPNRPYAVPYDAWGPPYGGVNGKVESNRFSRGFPTGKGRYGDNRRENGKHSEKRWQDDNNHRHYSRKDYRVDSRSRVREQYNGLYDGRGIPGDDGHYLDNPSRLEQLNDRQFYSKPLDR